MARHSTWCISLHHRVFWQDLFGAPFTIAHGDLLHHGAPLQIYQVCSRHVAGEGRLGGPHSPLLHLLAQLVVILVMVVVVVVLVLVVTMFVEFMLARQGQAIRD